MWPSLLLAIAITTADPPCKVLEPVELRGVRREPVAAAKHPDAKFVAIANSKSGTLLFWDLEKKSIKQEFKVGDELRDVVNIGWNEYVVIDSKKDELIQVRYADEQLTELRRYSLPRHPAAIRRWHAKNQIHLAISSLWARQVTVWLSPPLSGDALTVGEFRKTLVADLPFEPQLLNYQRLNNTFVEGHSKLQVADAFGGGMAEVDLKNGKVRAWHEPVHNFGSLEDGGFDEFIITHQRSNPRLPITEAAFSSGEFMQNRIAAVSNGKSITSAHVFSLAVYGEIKRSSTTPQPAPPKLELKSDPSGIGSIGRAEIVCLAGTDEIAILSSHWQFLKRVPVGKRPRTAVCLDFDHALVLGELDDTVTIVDASEVSADAELNKIRVNTFPLDPLSVKRELSPAERGEQLFFSAKSSAGQVMSCHSCHTDGHTNGLLADTLGDNTYGTPKRVLTLRGTRMTDPWAWNGEMKTLHDNVHKSLLDTMHAPKIEPRDVDDLVSFLHTLPPVPPLKPKPKDDADAAQVARGERIFAREGCTSCHVPPLTFTSPGAYDVGMPDEKGLAKFNPPSPRGVGRLRRLFHDNRATSLKDVFETYGHQLKELLPTAELADLVRYLESL